VDDHKSKHEPGNFSQDEKERPLVERDPYLNGFSYDVDLVRKFFYEFKKGTEDEDSIQRFQDCEDFYEWKLALEVFINGYEFVSDSQGKKSGNNVKNFVKSKKKNRELKRKLKRSTKGQSDVHFRSSGEFPEEEKEIVDFYPPREDDVIAMVIDEADDVVVSDVKSDDEIIDMETVNFFVDYLKIGKISVKDDWDGKEWPVAVSIFLKEESGEQEKLDEKNEIEKEKNEEKKEKFSKNITKKYIPARKPISA